MSLAQAAKQARDKQLADIVESAGQRPQVGSVPALAEHPPPAMRIWQCTAHPDLDLHTSVAMAWGHSLRLPPQWLNVFLDCAGGRWADAAH